MVISKIKKSCTKVFFKYELLVFLLAYCDSSLNKKHWRKTRNLIECKHHLTRKRLLGGNDTQYGIYVQRLLISDFVLHAKPNHRRSQIQSFSVALTSMYTYISAVIHFQINVCAFDHHGNINVRMI